MTDIPRDPGPDHLTIDDLLGTHGPLARQSDPETSRQAAESIVPHIRQSQMAVLDVIRRYPDGLSLEHLVEEYRSYSRNYTHGIPMQSDSGIRTRCRELVTLGFVEDSGERTTTASNRKAVVWKVTEKGRRAWQER